MSNLLFDDVRQWRVCLWSGVCKAAWGLWRIVSCLLFGLLSVFWWIGKQMSAFCKREFVASLIIAVVLLSVVFGWLTTFINERTMRVAAEHERDSVAYVFRKKMEIYEPYREEVLLSGDTIKVW